MDHRLSPELEELRRTVEEFAHDVVAPKIGDFYERHEFPYEIVREMGRMGLFGLPFPEEYGGMGGDYLALGLVLEELARVDSSVAITLEAGVSLGAMPIHLFGTDAQKAEWLPRLCSGEILGAFGLTEPDGGSDAGATRTTARLDPDTDEWVINGSKCFITNSGTDITGLVTVTAVTGRKPDGKPLISSIIVPSGTPASPSRRRTRRSAGTPRTPASCPSRTSASRRPTCWANRAAATPSSSASWTRAASPSRRSRPVSRRAVSTSR
ncbi:acyl-CoA dehydrogenase family protein [Streptomyces sp. AD2-2]|nr:acyl-CoA dehydrogenase family protein [Streptomyces sp. AD2-2]